MDTVPDRSNHPNRNLAALSARREVEDAYSKAETWGDVFANTPISEINHPISGSVLSKAVRAKKEAKGRSTRPRAEQEAARSFSGGKMNVGTAEEVLKNIKKIPWMMAK